ncbi:hypothetical protein HDF22_005327 [Mucilaginibacter lappiensis]|uniref:Uncharacterized protein n=1 Tax=Mucilaginibacter lappiensis TaxID=354630 RepID=A0A841JNI8_9SPHI|nr:hypothetical protein [Mucilaginibacter lappiensis]
MYNKKNLNKSKLNIHNLIQKSDWSVHFFRIDFLIHRKEPGLLSESPAMLYKAGVYL